MKGYIIRRILQGIGVIFGIMTVVFVVMNSTGDPVRLMLSPDASEQEVTLMRGRLGLDRPLPVRYAIFIGGIVRGDFGQSLHWNNRPATAVVVERYPATLQLTLIALTWSIGLALILGTVAAAKRGTFLERSIMRVALLGQKAPSFWVGIMMILLFAVKLRWLPPTGRSGIESMIMPAIVLGLNPFARNTRLVRSCFLDVLSQDYITTARSKGLARHVILMRHALKNAAIPLLTIMGLQLPAALGGAVITETIFAWPGIGRLMIQAIGFRDFPVVLAGIFFTAVTLVLVNIIIDILYSVIDPRITVAAAQ